MEAFLDEVTCKEVGRQLHALMLQTPTGQPMDAMLHQLCGTIDIPYTIHLRVEKIDGDKPRLQLSMPSEQLGDDPLFVVINGNMEILFTEQNVDDYLQTLIIGHKARDPHFYDRMV